MKPHLSRTGVRTLLFALCFATQVIDVSNPTNCVLTGGYNTIGRSLGVAVSGHYAYVADGDAGLQVIDVSDPSNCVHVGGYNAWGATRDVAVSGRYAFLADEEAGLEIIDVSNPTNCLPVGGYNTSGYAIGVALSGNFAYVADHNAGVAVIDVSNPTNCVQVGTYDTTVRVDATPGESFTLEAATDLSDPNSWQPLLTTNVATMPFNFVDFDVKLSEKPQKFYRVRQP